MSEGKTWPLDREAWAALHAECPRNIPLAFKATCADKDVCQRSFAAGAAHEREECEGIAKQEEQAAAKAMQEHVAVSLGQRHYTGEAACIVACRIKRAIRARGKA